MKPRLGASLDYKANRVGFDTPPAHPTPHLLHIFITPNGVAVLRCPAAHFFAVIRCKTMSRLVSCERPYCPAVSCGPFFSGHPLQDDVPPTVLRTPMLSCGPFLAVIRCRTMSRLVSCEGPCCPAAHFLAVIRRRTMSRALSCERPRCPAAHFLASILCRTMPRLLSCEGPS